MKDWYNAERRFVWAAPEPRLKNKWIEKIIMDKVRSGIRAGMANIIMKSRERRGLYAERDSVQKIN